MENNTYIRPSAILKDGDKLESLAEKSVAILQSAGTFEQEFVNATQITVTHNLNRRPHVTAVDSAGTKYGVEVEYVNANTLIVKVTRPMSGWIYCS